MTEPIMVESLTPLDLIMPGTYVQALFTFPCSVADVPTLKLQQGLTQLCGKYPWLSGRVTQVQQDTLQIQWKRPDLPPILSDNGSIETPYSQLAAHGMPPASIPPEVWPQVNVSEISHTGGVPVFAASLFRFAGGSGIGLCICVHHNVVDAAGFSHLLQEWASYCTDAQSPVTVSDENRVSRLSGALGADLEAASKQSIHELISTHPEYSETPPQLPTEFPVATSKVFRISASRLYLIKKRISDTAGAAPSTNTLLCALMWRAVTRARLRRSPALGAQTSSLISAVNGRRRLGPDFSTRENPYLGNVILYALTKAPVLGSKSGITNTGMMKQLVELCTLIDQAQSPTRIDRRFIADIYSLKCRLDGTAGIFPGWDLFNSRDLTVASWRDLDLYSLNFGPGLGCPGFVRPPHAAADGVGFVLPRKRLSASLDEHLEVMIMLREDDLDCLACDEEWKNVLEAW